MKEKKHTPGPWETCSVMCKHYVVAYAGTDKQIRVAELGSDARLSTEANAALLASAPTLLAERDEFEAKHKNALILLGRMSEQATGYRKERDALRDGLDDAILTVCKICKQYPGQGMDYTKCGMPCMLKARALLAGMKQEDSNGKDNNRA